MEVSNEGGMGKTNYFLALFVSVSKTMQDASKVTANEK